MDKSRISRSHHCNIHTNQEIISVCLQSDCYRPVLCLGCISDEEIHPSTHEGIISLEEFFIKVDNFNNKKKCHKVDEIPFLKEVADQYKGCMNEMNNKIDLEKKMVDDMINELISHFVLKCHTFKEEMMTKLDKQANTFKSNYKRFVKAVKKLPEQEKNSMKESSFIAVNQSSSYNQLEQIIKKHQKEIVALKEAPKEVDENLLKLKTIAQTLEENMNQSFGTYLTNSKLETLKEDMDNGMEKFFGKYLKFPTEVFPVELAVETKIDSKILNNKGFGIIQGFLNDEYREPIFDIIYRGSKDGFTAQDFYQNCPKGPTVLLIRSAKKKVFGGFTDADWIADESYQKSNKSFLFSMDFREKYPLKAGHQQYAIKGSKELGPCFGGGHDLRISANFKTEECSGYIGFSYEANGKYANDIYGDMNFLIDEIELFKVSEGYDDSDSVVSVEEYKENREKSEVKQIDYCENESSGDWEEVLLKNVASEEEKSPEINNKAKTETKGKGTSSISSLMTYEELEILLDWIDKKRDFTLDLIYKGSEHGFSSSDFHKKCDNMGPTLTLIKSKKFEQVFGGFTKQPWNQSNQPANCAETFLFSLTKKKKFPVSDVENAIFRSGASGPVFGNGDIFISSNCNKNTESYSNLGVGFDVAGLDDSVVFFADEQYFVVDEIEVFQVIFFE